MMETAVTGGLLFLNALCDIRKKEILLAPTLFVLGAGVVRAILAGPAGSAPWIPAVVPGLFLLFFSVFTGGKIGFGDGLAVCAAGVWCGLGSILIMLFFALVLVTAAAGFLRLRNQKVREMPFIPFLLAGFAAERILWWGG